MYHSQKNYKGWSWMLHPSAWPPTKYNEEVKLPQVCLHSHWWQYLHPQYAQANDVFYLTAFQNQMTTKYSGSHYWRSIFVLAHYRSNFLMPAWTLVNVLPPWSYWKQNKFSQQGSAPKMLPKRIPNWSSEVCIRDQSRSSYILSWSKRWQQKSSTIQK